MGQALQMCHNCGRPRDSEFTGVDEILKAHDWHQYSRVVDLDGNSGKFLSTILAAKGHERQQGVLFQAQVVADEGAREAAASLAESAGVSARMSFAAGDIHKAGQPD